jgi:hypothetical protein
LSCSVLVGADFGVEEEALVGEGLMDRGARSSGFSLEALRQGIEQRRIDGIVISVEVEIEQATGPGYRPRARRAGRALVGGVDEAVAVAIPEARKLMHGQFPVGAVHVPLDQPPGLLDTTHFAERRCHCVTRGLRPQRRVKDQADHVPVGVLMDVQYNYSRYYPINTSC